MAGNQREMQRREKRAKKDKRNRIIIWIIIALIVVVLAVMKVCEININSVKNHFTDENGNFTLTNGVVTDNFPYNLDSSSNVVLKPVNNKIGILTPTAFTVLDSSDATEEYSFDHGYSNPIISSSGVYSLIIDQGAKMFRLDTTSDNVYQSEAKNNILCADVAKNGTVVYATTSSEKKSEIYVITKSLKEKLHYSVSYGYVIAVAVNDTAGKIAFAAVNSENAQLKTMLYTMDASTGEIKGEFDITSGNIADLEYSGRNLIVVGDNFAGMVSNQKKYEQIYKSGDINTVCFTYTPSKGLILVYNDYINSTDNNLVYIKNGKIKTDIKISGNIKAVSASSSLVSVLTGNEIITYNISNGEEKKKSKVDDSVKSICSMGSDVFVHRQSLVDRNEAE
ncbi:MAG: DUF5711 family protein [Eubacterium sp.]